MAGAGVFRRGRPEARLDPVRWRPPGLLRSVTVALLVAVAGVLAWSGPSSCTPGLPSRAAPGASGLVGSGSGDAGLADPDLPDLAGAGSGPLAAAGRRPAVPAGSVGVPLRLIDPAALALLAPGDRVDVLRVEDSGRTAEVASAALVLGVTDAGDLVTAGLLVALTPADAQRAVAHQGRGFAVLLRPG